MGTWGTGIFDNDDASDWAYGLAEGGIGFVEDSLVEVLTGDYVEAPVAAGGLAAADLVARLLTGGGENSPYAEPVADWVKANSGLSVDELLDKARRVVERVGQDGSELLELWEDSGEAAAWRSVSAGLLERLQ